jgi:hypothetical protein
MPRTTEDIAKELFERKKIGAYLRAIIVTSHDREDLTHYSFIRAEDGYDIVLDQLNQCIQYGDHPLGMILATALPGLDGFVGLETYLYPEYEAVRLGARELRIGR